MSEKFTGHGIVGNNAWARPGGSEQKITRKDPAEKIAEKIPQKFPDFIYTENRRAAGTRFYLHKEFARARARTFLYTKNFLRKFMQNQ